MHFNFIIITFKRSVSVICILKTIVHIVCEYESDTICIEDVFLNNFYYFLLDSSKDEGFELRTIKWEEGHKMNK